jgi:hypothetical protein
MGAKAHMPGVCRPADAIRAIEESAAGEGASVVYRGEKVAA